MTQIGHGFESLEERTLLAANVTATLSNGTLTITGDASANDIHVYGYGNQGAILVEVGNGQTLKINGGTQDGSAYGHFKGVANIVVNGGGGNDFLEADAIRIGGSLSMNAGAGTNQFVDVENDYGNVYIGGSVSLNAGTNGGVALHSNSENTITIYGNVTENGTYLQLGADYGKVNIGGNVTLNVNSVAGGYGYGVIFAYGDGAVAVGKNVKIEGGAGSDEVGFVATAGNYGFGGHHVTHGITVAGNVTVDGNGGNDAVAIAAYGGYGITQVAYGYGYGSYGVVTGFNSETVTIYGNTTLTGGAGNDAVGLLSYGSSINVGNNLSINGGAGNNTVGVAAFTVDGYGQSYLPGQATSYAAIAVGGTTNIVGGTGNGSDFVGVYGLLAANNVTLSGGGTGGDAIIFANSVAEKHVTMTGSSGSDFLGVYGSLIGKGLTMNGGGGFDYGTVQATSINGGFVKASIENFF